MRLESQKFLMQNFSFIKRTFFENKKNRNFQFFFIKIKLRLVTA